MKSISSNKRNKKMIVDNPKQWTHFPILLNTAEKRNIFKIVAKEFNRKLFYLTARSHHLDDYDRSNLSELPLGENTSFTLYGDLNEIIRLIAFLNFIEGSIIYYGFDAIENYQAGEISNKIIKKRDQIVYQRKKIIRLNFQ